MKLLSIHLHKTQELQKMFSIKHLLILFILIGGTARVIRAMERPACEDTPLLRVTYTSFPSRAQEPPADIELGQANLKKRKTTLMTAISKKDIQLCKSSFEKEFEWVNRLYLAQRFNNNQISKTAHEELQEKLRFTHQVFIQINAAIAKEEARLELVRKLSAPALFNNHSIQVVEWLDNQPRLANISLSLLAIGLATLYGITHLPTYASASDPCFEFPADKQAEIHQACCESSVATNEPCTVNTHNDTSIRLMYYCCQNILNALCMNNVTDYNKHVYPKKMWHAWTPELVVIPSLAALQIAFQLGACYYRRAYQSHVPFKQLLAQKNDDLAQVEQELKNFEIIDGSNFQEL
jgi:hypothetical protein